MPVGIADVAEIVYYNEDSLAPLTIVKPPAFMPGQLLVFIIAQHAINNLAALTGPAGWTDCGNFDDVGGQVSARVWSHMYNGADPSTWDFGYDAGADVAAALIRITGAESTPIISLVSSTAGVVSGSTDSPTITPAGINDLLVCALAPACNNTPLVETDPSGLTNRDQTQVIGLYMALALATRQLTDGNSTGAETWTNITPANIAAGTFSIVIKSSSFLDPDPPPNPPPPLVPPWLFRQLAEARQQPVVGHQGTPVVKEKLSGGASNVNVTLTTAATTAVDDLLVVFHGNNFYTAAGLTTPTGTAGTWTLRATGDNGTNSAHMKIWTRLVTVAGAQTVTVAQAIDEEHTVSLFVVSGVDTAGFIDGVAASSGAASVSHVAPTVTTGTPNPLLLVATQSTALGAYTIPGTFGMFKQTQIDVIGICSASSGAEVVASANPTGTRTFTNAVSGAFATGTIALKSPQLAVAPTTTTVNAECATFTMDAQDLTATIAASAIDAAIGITVSDPADLINPAAEGVALTVAAQDAALQAAPVPAEAAVALAGMDAQVSISATAESLTFTFTAQDATVSTAAGTSAVAEVATYTFTANDATAALLATAESLTFTLSAQDATILTAILANAEVASFILSAQDASVITAVLATSEVATFTFAAQNATVLTGTVVNAEAATFTFSAQDATVTTAGNTNVLAEVATLTVAGLDASSSLGLSAQNATFVMAGNDSTMLINIASGIGLIALSAFDASTFQPSGFMSGHDSSVAGMNSNPAAVSSMNISTASGSTMGGT